MLQSDFYVAADHKRSFDLLAGRDVMPEIEEIRANSLPLRRLNPHVVNGSIESRGSEYAGTGGELLVSCPPLPTNGTTSNSLLLTTIYH